MTCANVVNKIESFKFFKNAVHLLWGLSLKYSTPKTKCMDEYALVK